MATTRAILTRFGYVQGWRMANAMQDLIQWESEEDWHHACGRIHMLGGMYRLASTPASSLKTDGLTLDESDETEQHIALLGKSDISVCWTICGLASGYLSRALGGGIDVLEESCIGCGDAACHLFGRTMEEWGDARAEELRFFREENLKDRPEPSLHRITEELKATEKRLRIKEAGLGQGRPLDRQRLRDRHPQRRHAQGG